MKLLGISSRGMAALAALMTAVALVGCPPELQGTLTVEIQPPEVRDEARWIVDGEEYESGEEAVLPPGEYDIEFTGPDDWTAPPPREGVSVSENEVTQESVDYTEPVADGDAKVNVLLTSGQHEKFASEVVRNLEVSEKQGPLDVEEIASLVVTVREIRFDGPTGVEEDHEEKVPGGQHIVFEGKRDVDIMHLREVSELISVANVPAGEYTKIRLHIENPRLWLAQDQDMEALEEGEEDPDPLTDIHLTANGRLFVSESFTLVADQPNYVVLDFQDLHLVQTGQRDRYVFTPQIRAHILVDEHTVTMEGVITYLPEDEQWFRLELADRETIDVAYLEDTSVLDLVGDPPVSDVDGLEEGMRIRVHGTLWPGEDVWPEVSAFDIEILQYPVWYEGIIMTELDPEDPEGPWFTLVLADGSLVEVSYSDDTLVFDDTGDEPHEVEIDEDIDEYLTPGMRVWVFGGLWVDEDGEIESISALDIWIEEEPVAIEGFVTDLGGEEEPWFFEVELDDGSTFVVWYGAYTNVLDADGAVPVDDLELEVGMRVWIFGGLWVDEDGEVVSISALDVEIAEHPVEPKPRGIIEDLDRDRQLFRLVSNGEEPVDVWEVWYSPYTNIVDGDGESVDIDTLDENIEVEVSGARWSDDTVTALEIRILPEQ